MTVAVIVLAAAYPVTAFFTFRYLHERDVSDRIERATLHQRIQAPEQAVTEHAQHTLPGPMTMAPLSDDETFTEAERMMTALQRELEAR
jgi:methionine synthase II (cobalamin-independent)